MSSGHSHARGFELVENGDGVRAIALGDSVDLWLAIELPVELGQIAAVSCSVIAMLKRVGALNPKAKLGVIPRWMSSRSASG